MISCGRLQGDRDSSVDPNNSAIPTRISDIIRSDDSNSSDSVPSNAAVSMSFTDSDMSAGQIQGIINIAKASDESEIDYYNIYWGSNSTRKLSSTAIDSISSINTLVRYTIPGGTTPPAGATHFLVFTANDVGEMSVGISLLIDDLGLPTNAATSVAFTDSDTDGGELSGDVNISKATDESDVTTYALYWGSSTTTKQSGTAINTFTADGGNHTHTFAANTAIPSGATHLLVFTQNDDGEMATGQNVAIVDMGVPANAAVSLTLTDTDSDGGELSGDVNISKAVDESDVTTYALYWGSGTTTKQSGTAINTFTADGGNHTHTFAANTAIPSGATHLLVFTQNDDGEMATGVNVLIDDIGVPSSTASSVSFTDTDSTGSELSGDVDITAAGDESDITHYVLYWGSNASTKQSGTAIDEISVTGSDVTHTFAADTPIPAGATHLLVYTKNDDGEMAANVNVAIDDYGLPEETAGSLSFSDTDNDEDELSGDLTITKASDESDITHYVLYWGSDATTKQSGTPISTIAVTGSDLIHTFSADTAQPVGASHFLVFTRNDDGEMATGVNLAIVDEVSAVADYTPDAIDWTDYNQMFGGGTLYPSNTITVSGINQTITLDASINSGNPFNVYVNGVLEGSGAPFSFDVENGDTVYFTTTTSCSPVVATIRNSSDGNALIDTFTFSVGVCAP